MAAWPGQCSFSSELFVRSRNCFLNPYVYADICFEAKTIDFEALVLYCLFVSTDTNIPVIHFYLVDGSADQGIIIVVFDAARVGCASSRIAEEIIAYLAGLVGAEVTVTLEIEAKIPSVTPEYVVRIVTENSQALKLSSWFFERE